MAITEIAGAVRAQILGRRDTVEIYGTLDPFRTALIVIDMQNAFCNIGGALGVESARSIVPNINQLAKRVRDAGGSVYWIQMSVESAGQWPVYLGDIVSRPAVVEDILADLDPRGEGWKLLPELDVQNGDTVLTKDRFSAFLEKHCDLMSHLQRKTIDTVIITGTLTNVCCESSARDAAMQDYKVVFVADANAARSDVAHERTLENIAQCFGDVRTTRQVLEMISNQGPSASHSTKQ